MSYARSNSLPVNVLLGQKPEKKRPRGLLRRLAKAIPGRKKKGPGSDNSAGIGDEYGSGSEFESNDSTQNSPQPLTPSASLDSLDAIPSTNCLVRVVHDETDSAILLPRPLLNAKVSPTQPVETLKEIKTFLQCLQSDNKNSQVFISNDIVWHYFVAWWNLWYIGASY